MNPQLNDDDRDEIAEAVTLARSHGMKLELIDADVWQFVLSIPGEWSITLWPCFEGNSQKERIAHDPAMPGPRLALPRYWLLIDAVEAAVRKLTGVPDPENCRGPETKRSNRRPIPSPVRKKRW